MSRFVILEHDAPFLHWDFLLEQADALRAWRLHSVPQLGAQIVAEPLPDHRKMYLDYEGPVTQNRGSVHQWDSGEYRVIDEAADWIVVELAGQRCQTVCHLERCESSTDWTWRLTPP